MNLLETASIVSTEEDLVRKMQAGDDQAFALLYEQYFDKLYRFIYRRVSHRETAEDLVGKVFEKAFVHRTNFVWKGTSFGAWLYRIATNAITDHWRSHRPTDELERIPEPKAVQEGTDPGKVTDQVLLSASLQTVLEHLSEREQLCVTLKYIEGYGNKEIADIVELDANNVGIILHRALKKCRKHLPSGWDSGGSETNSMVDRLDTRETDSDSSSV